MGIAYSETAPIFVSNIDGSTAASLLGMIHTVLSEYCHLAYENVENGNGGYLYALLSDQNLRSKVRIWDAGAAPALGNKGRLIVRFESDDESVTGVPHPIIYDADRVYELNVSRQQIALALTGYSSNLFDGQLANAVIGGIPFIPELPLLCLDEPIDSEQDPEEVWWSSGSGYGLYSGQQGYGFRSGWRNGGWWDGYWDGYHGGVLDNNIDSGSGLRLAVTAPPLRDWNTLQEVEWYDESALYTEPMIMWGPATGQPCVLRGQIWDAVAGSKHAELDAEQTSEEHDENGNLLGTFRWRNFLSYQGTLPAYGHPGSYFASLWLLRDKDGAEAEDTENDYVY